ncbi:hypothetical protein [Bacteroides ovatus]|uniref:hypothetical protein n=1 Tax=Bacteroides ovatus TaxID=28116 RepID=UPI00189C4B03|nr:hypothetical protein [Bacteroides ovatus]MDC2625469.1 hypothetical protein [Bacteroides ovatus]MDC2639356.1 hypothetical protein [Bacteroides ovatus]MDC2653773.1 hypothetical protein [Bacteroides ovatus]
MKAREKDQILSEIQADTLDYKNAIHGEIISELERLGYIDITRTKDGSFFDITDKGETFLNDGGFSKIEKEKQKEKRKEYVVRIVFLVLGAIIVKLIDLLFA